MRGAAVGLVLTSLSAAAVRRLPAHRYALGKAANQAARQIGGAIAVTNTVAVLGHGAMHRIDVTPLYSLHIELVLLTAAPFRLHRDTARLT